MPPTCSTLPAPRAGRRRTAPLRLGRHTGDRREARRRLPAQPPLPPDPDGTLVDRGHLIPHLSGGAFGPNIFRQHRALNRGWSEEGKRFRALEREAATAPGMFYFGHLVYEDDSAYPTMIETGLPRGGELRVEGFRNRFLRH